MRFIDLACMAIFELRSITRSAGVPCCAHDSKAEAVGSSDATMLRICLKHHHAVLQGGGVLVDMVSLFPADNGR